MGITIKQATPQDAPFLAQMMLQSSRAGKKEGFFDLLFGTNDNSAILDALEKLAQTEAKSRCHYKNFLIASMDANPVGTLCSYEPRIATGEAFMNALAEIGCAENDEIVEIIHECDFKLNTRVIMFDFMEELEGFIDVGILKALMQKSLLSARLKGYTIAQTIIEIGSLENELFYKKLGFKIVAQKECELYREKFGRSGFMLLSTEF
jgi:hypothetical protein